VADLHNLFRSTGGLEQEEAWRVSDKLDIGKGVADGQRAIDLLLRSVDYSRETSEALRKFHSVIEMHGERICRDFLAQDGNRDGMLNIHGLKAAVL
jgi:hypothetical protein